MGHDLSRRFDRYQSSSESYFKTVKLPKSLQKFSQSPDRTDKHLNDKIALSNLPGCPTPPSFTSRKPELIISSTQVPEKYEKSFDVNKLPRETSQSAELVAAIDDVNRKLETANDKYINSEIVSFNGCTKNPKDSISSSGSSQYDPDIDFLEKEVERRLKSNLKRVKKLENTEKEMTQTERNLKLKRFHSNDNNRNRKIQETKSRELSDLDEIEGIQKKKILEQDREIAIRNMKLQDALLIEDTLEEFDKRISKNSSERSYDVYIKRERINPGTGFQQINNVDNKYTSIVTKYDTKPHSQKFEIIDRNFITPSQVKMIKKPSNKVSKSLYLETINNLIDEQGNLLTHNEKVKYLGELKQASSKIKSTMPVVAEKQLETELLNSDLKRLSTDELEQLAIVILEDQRNQKDKNKEIVKYYYNREEIYPNGIIKDVIDEAKFKIYNTKDSDSKNHKILDSKIHLQKEIK